MKTLLSKTILKEFAFTQHNSLTYENISQVTKDLYVNFPKSLLCYNDYITLAVFTLQGGFSCAITAWPLRENIFLYYCNKNFLSADETSCNNISLKNSKIVEVITDSLNPTHTFSPHKRKKAENPASAYQSIVMHMHDLPHI